MYHSAQPYLYPRPSPPHVYTYLLVFSCQFPSNTISPFTPAALCIYSQIDCEICPEGKFNAEYSSISCKGCPEGTYGPLQGAVKDERIVCPDPGGLCDCSQIPCIPPPTCKDCPAGTYSSAIGIKEDYECEACPQGLFSTRTRQTAFSTCTKCPKGRYQNELAAISRGDTCPSGPDCTRECKHCSAGKYLDYEGEVSPDSCVDCSAGKYSTNIDSVYSVYKSGASLCSKCAKGRYSDVLASTSFDNCTEW